MSDEEIVGVPQRRTAGWCKEMRREFLWMAHDSIARTHVESSSQVFELCYCTSLG